MVDHSRQNRECFVRWRMWSLPFAFVLGILLLFWTTEYKYIKITVTRIHFLRIHLWPRIRIHFIFCHKIRIQLLGERYGPQPIGCAFHRGLSPFEPVLTAQYRVFGEAPGSGEGHGLSLPILESSIEVGQTLWKAHPLDWCIDIAVAKEATEEYHVGYLKVYVFFCLDVAFILRSKILTQPNQKCPGNTVLVQSFAHLMLQIFCDPVEGGGLTLNMVEYTQNMKPVICTWNVAGAVQTYCYLPDKMYFF